MRAAAWLLALLLTAGVTPIVGAATITVVKIGRASCRERVYVLV